MINNVSGTFEETARILAGMSAEEWGELCKELFRYDSGNPVHRTEVKMVKVDGSTEDREVAGVGYCFQSQQLHFR